MLPGWGPPQETALVFHLDGQKPATAVIVEVLQGALRRGLLEGKDLAR